MCSIVGSRSCKRHREGAGAWLRSRHAVLSLNWIAYSCWSLWSRSSLQLTSTYAHQVLQCLVLPPVILSCSNLLLNSSIAPCQAGSGHAAPLIPPNHHKHIGPSWVWVRRASYLFLSIHVSHRSLDFHITQFFKFFPHGPPTHIVNFENVQKHRNTIRMPSAVNTRPCWS